MRKSAAYLTPDARTRLSYSCPFLVGLSVRRANPGKCLRLYLREDDVPSATLAALYEAHLPGCSCLYLGYLAL